MRELIDSYDGLLPADLHKYDLDADNSPEIIALLKHPDGIDIMPHIYRLDENFQRVFPPSDTQDFAPIICRELVLTANDSTPMLCTKNPVNIHEFGPPELYELEYYRLNRGKLELFDHSYSDGDHFNILMNRGAIAFNECNYLEAVEYYNQAISSSTGEITTKAFIEALFFLAEARKFTKDFSSALPLYQKIVLEFKQNQRTDAAQREFELISANIVNSDALSYLVDVMILVNSNKLEEALTMVTARPDNTSCLDDRFLFVKAEILAAQNRINDAIVAFNQLKETFPASPLIDETDRLLQDLQEDPAEANGL